MSQYLILQNIKVGNANAISGFTYGFPSITNFLGYVHALSRKLQQSHGIELSDVGVISHDHQIHAHRGSKQDPYTFALSRAPLTAEGKTAPITEEGRMHFTASLVIWAEGLNLKTKSIQLEQCEAIKELAEQHKLAGGRIESIEACYLSKTSGHRAILRRLFPGSALVDRSELLAKMDGPSPLLNWLDVASLKYSATDTPINNLDDSVEWALTNPNEGYLVPIQVGFKKIAPTYQAGRVKNVRDKSTPFSFVESVHSIGEWVNTTSKIDSIDDIMWQYHTKHPFYIARVRSSEHSHSHEYIES